MFGAVLIKIDETQILVPKPNFAAKLQHSKGLF